MGERARSRTLAGIGSTSSYRTVASRLALPRTAGSQAAQGWLAARGCATQGHALSRWHATILLAPEDFTPMFDFDERVATRFRIEIYSEEWGYLFCHRGRGSWIRVTDIPFVHGRDDFGLVAATPALHDLGLLLRRVEADHQLHFRRDHALVRTNLAGSETAIRRWVETL